MEDTNQENNNTDDKTTDAGADASAQASESKSMLDIDKIVNDKGTDTADKANDQVTDKIPGQKAERPAWMTKDKFWDAEKGEVRNEDIFKSYTELEKMVGAGAHKVPDKPEGYKVTLNDEQKSALFGKPDANPMEDPMYKGFTELAHKHKISQAAVSDILQLYAGNVQNIQENSGMVIDVAAEKAKLGKNADAVIDAQMNFLGALYKSGEISQTELREAQILFETAAGINLFQKIRAHYGEQSIPTDVNAEKGDIPSGDELAKMLLDPKYETDKDFRKTVDDYYKRRYGTQPAMSS